MLSMIKSWTRSRFSIVGLRSGSQLLFLEKKMSSLERLYLLTDFTKMFSVALPTQHLMVKVIVAILESTLSWFKRLLYGQILTRLHKNIENDNIWDKLAF